MEPLAAFIIALVKVLIWPVALFLLFYLKGEALLALFQQHTIRVKRKRLYLGNTPSHQRASERPGVVQGSQPTGGKTPELEESLNPPAPG